MKHGTRGKLVAGMAVGIAMLAMIGTALHFMMRQAYQSTQLLEDADRAVLQLTRAVSALGDAETGQRGYLLTADESYLEPYFAGRRQVMADLRLVRHQLLLTGITEQSLDAVEADVQKKLDELDRTVSLRRAGAFDEAVAIVTSDQGKALMDRLRGRISDITAQVETFLDAESERRIRVRNRIALAVVGGMLTLFLCLTFFGSLLLRDLRLRAEYETALARQREWLHTTLVSIGDGMLATDAQGRIVLMNTVAEKLTGWTLDQAKGRPHTEVFNIINAASRQTVESPVDHAIRDGVIVGLANHTLLIDRQGVERPIEDSGAPIRGADNAIEGVVLVFRDVSERDKAEAELRESEHFSVTVINSSGDCIEVLSPSGDIESINTAGLRLLEVHSPAGLQGRPWTNVWDDHADDAIGAIAAAHSGRPGRFTGARMTHEGVIRWWDVLVTPVYNHEQKVARLLAISRDITERKSIELEKERLLAAERAARSEAERVSRVKDEFVATLSHELRTPLTAILGWAQLLGKGRTQGDDLISGLETIERNARVQVQMIDELLDMSRIISGKLRLDVQRVDVPGAIHAAIESIRPAVEAKGIRLQVTLDPRTNIVRGDPTRIQQIVWNLLSNAVKFTPKGGKIQIALARVNSHVEVSVSDNGKGIRPEFLTRIFDRFSQEDSTTTRRFGGLGLGLSIVKQLVELHGGTVRVTSPGEDQGSTFIVELPVIPVHELAKIERPDYPDAQTPAVETVPHTLRGVKVLVVDDEADSRELVRHILREAEANVCVAGSVQEGIEIFKSFRPDVLLSDIGMPIQDGYELIRCVRVLSPVLGGATPAAALTALARSEDRTRALRAGFQVHVAKPIESAELLAVVASLALMRPTSVEREPDL